ncbi:52 kDa Protein kinase [Spodoptera frugiperda ascovirus 1a]|uniref:non-specific serine/threonine protein kinase n=1 Tax=Spodoptera frugiperda ascovirus 1a TaxID=113370 RepID=Q0E519_SFAVA|nr:52 kDa Protein kinase [Spodoptera frugiperda ascovirus 1a]CAL44682.1 52 kDa Protein kinase [Spodoptera frugiperda ascovirus 1a]
MSLKNDYDVEASGTTVGLRGLRSQHRAVHKSTNSRCTLIEYTDTNSSTYARAVNEINIVARLDHYNLIRMHCTWMESTTVRSRCIYLRTSPVHGTLADLMVRGWRDEGSSVRVRLMLQLADAVRYLFGAGIVHHDITPSNLHINPNGTRLTVANFGKACEYNGRVHDNDECTVRCSGAKLRSESHRLYADTRQLRGECHRHCDMYSVGVVLYEVLQEFTDDVDKCQRLDSIRCKGVTANGHRLRWMDIADGLVNGRDMTLRIQSLQQLSRLSFPVQLTSKYDCVRNQIDAIVLAKKVFTSDWTLDGIEEVSNVCDHTGESALYVIVTMCMFWAFDAKCVQEFRRRVWYFLRLFIRHGAMYHKNRYGATASLISYCVIRGRKRLAEALRYSVTSTNQQCGGHTLFDMALRSIHLNGGPVVDRLRDHVRHVSEWRFDGDRLARMMIEDAEDDHGH